MNFIKVSKDNMKEMISLIGEMHWRVCVSKISYVSSVLKKFIYAHFHQRELISTYSSFSNS